MAVMKGISPVMFCKRCHAPLIVVEMQTFHDASGTKLHELMANMDSIALCEPCQRQKFYYASIGKLREWETGVY